jgi:FHA domain
LEAGDGLVMQVLSTSGATTESFPVDAKSYYTFGREQGSVDVLLTGSGASRLHAALVHHEDGKVYLIDLQSVSYQSARTRSLYAALARVRYLVRYLHTDIILSLTLARVAYAVSCLRQ